ncbi:hypothetical protein NHX12_013434 [Muraenolepis orangiensis]|uniref:Uncharacterized protein n=1 Tax=Muraenolepis orangiensis TaxID=630683 RepID=A0A9Q0DDT2_9TELE|nr:hypothetical protein NHX12_013434 [Muraenolepis orangiensis]
MFGSWCSFRKDGEHDEPPGEEVSLKRIHHGHISLGKSNEFVVYVAFDPLSNTVVSICPSKRYGGRGGTVTI